MNATRIQRVTAMINFTLVTLISNAVDKIQLKDRQYLGFEEAIKIPGMMLSMYRQVNLDLSGRRAPFYLAAVIEGDIQYIIMGSHEQWKWFFSVKWDYLLRHCPCVIGVN